MRWAKCPSPGGALRHPDGPRARELPRQRSRVRIRAGHRHRAGEEVRGGSQPRDRPPRRPRWRAPSSAAADEVLAGPAPRSVRGRRLSGRRRHLAQHERERGAREPRGGVARRTPRQLHARCTPTITSTWASRPTTSTRRRRGWRCSSATSRSGQPRRAAWLPRWTTKAAAVRARAEGGPHAPAGCRADDARPGVRRLRGVHRARRGSTSRRRAGSCSN